MPMYLIEASYGTEGVKGIAAKGGTARRETVGGLIASMGGKIESFYFAFGDADAFVIVDAPDHATVAAASMTISASGAGRTKTTVLLTPEELDQAAKKTMSYRAPGQ